MEGRLRNWEGSDRKGVTIEAAVQRGRGMSPKDVESW